MQLFNGANAMTTATNRANEAVSYRRYCQAIASLQPTLQGEALQQHIKATVVLSYSLLFGDASLRQRSLNQHQLSQLAQHRDNMVALIEQAKAAGRG
jgi:hypothetical protein